MAKKKEADEERRLEHEKWRQEEEARDKEYIRRRFVTPECCQKMQDTAVICLILPDTFGDGDIETPPKWMVRAAYAMSHEHHRWQDAHFCPYCAAPVPEIVKRDTGDAKLMIADDGYCKVCGERCMCCRCLSGVFRWMPKGSTKTLPPAPQYDDEEEDDDA
jgi:hypothetical protein